MKKKLLFGFIIISVLLLAISCNNEKSSNNTPQLENNANNDTIAGESEEATVSLMIHWGEDAFEDYFNKFVKEALPHIELTYIQAGNKSDIEENFSKGLVPDLVMGSNFQMYGEMDLTMDQRNLIEKHGLDLERFDPGIIESLENASSEGKLLALPLFRPDGMMGYNKDVFDTFGVPHPEDHMTWDEVIEIAKKVTGERDGRIYRGVWPDKDQLSQVSSTLLNADDEPNIIDNTELRIFLERQVEIFNIPSNLPEIDSVEELAEHMYSKSGSTDLLFDYALVPGVGFHSLLSLELNEGLNFDWVTYPVWGGDYPDHIPNSLYHNIFVTSQSENPDAAFEVLSYFLSDEFQKYSMNEGRLTPLLSEEVRSEIGKDMEHYELLVGKNWKAQFKILGAPVPEQSIYEGDIREKLMMNAYQRILEGDDINTIIRKMDEEAQALVADFLEKE